MVQGLSNEEYNSILRSFYNIAGLFTNQDPTDQKLVNCIYHWGRHLDVSDGTLRKLFDTPQEFPFQQPKDKYDAIEQIYDLVFMIYLDNVVEDSELEITMHYAQELGFPSHIVGDLAKAIETAPYDGIPRKQVRNELKELLELNEDL